MIDFISFYSFYFIAILCIITILQKSNKKVNLLLFFIIGSICCKLLNIFFKNLIAEPLDPTVFPNRTTNIYANPSGHAQMNAFCIGFLYFYLHQKSVFIIPIAVAIFLLCFVTCIRNRYHTYHQLFLGTIIGLLFGVFWGFVSIKLNYHL